MSDSDACDASGKHTQFHGEINFECHDIKARLYNETGQFNLTHRTFIKNSKLTKMKRHEENGG